MEVEGQGGRFTVLSTIIQQGICSQHQQGATVVALTTVNLSSEQVGMWSFCPLDCLSVFFCTWNQEPFQEQQLTDEHSGKHVLFFLFFLNYWLFPEDLLATHYVGLMAAASPGSRRSDDLLRRVFFSAPNCCTCASTPSDPCSGVGCR